MECDELDIDKIADKAEVFVTALPHGISKEVIPKLIEKGKRIVDHSGDFRYKSVEVYEKWYNTTHGMPHLLDLSVYGLPELHREEIKNAQIVGNPGCYPTCSILGLAPLIKNRLVDTKNIIIDAASGVSGAGRKTDLPYQFCECTENFKAYNVSTHRHTSEIEQELSLLAGEELTVSFTPHLVPMKRGMLATIYANLNCEKSTSELIELYKEYYKNEYFVRILDEGKLPETKFVAGSNFIDIGLVVDKRLNRVIVLSAIDNLGKGAAGQAVQDLNIMFGLPEHRGLENSGLYL
ncbi:N-acetyl-gamma-glutamyl-phosphate reductase [Acetivibrio straminisolvens JCM 21531]|uniref:N-acetyl-gamma-glutamyl-phosphate reductase n=2 Tax=Acetivibrio straminisolvens TaxID=253314 RepID=W4V650_9FIRM|nr:N-acetyl-gamma-glutamyl-phosphate reductase [Acetivibrio straminisolvens JCM 21531]